MIFSQWWRRCRNCCCRRSRKLQQDGPAEPPVQASKDLAPSALSDKDQVSVLEAQLLPEGEIQSLVESLNGACRICLEPADVGDYQVCACRGSQGFAHIQCLADLAASKWPSLDPWRQCPTCKQNYVDRVHLALSKALWEGAQDQSEDVRRAAAGQLGLALFATATSTRQPPSIDRHWLLAWRI